MFSPNHSPLMLLKCLIINRVAPGINKLSPIFGKLLVVLGNLLSTLLVNCAEFALQSPGHVWKMLML